MPEPTVRRLAVPGAELYYEVRGSGPTLLVVGQPMSAEPFGPTADLLATDHTVITYDPHGLGRSTMDDIAEPVTPEVEADDLARIIDEVGGGPADAFGTSGGGVAVLALATRSPERVRTVIAHEPPVTELLPDAEDIRAAVDATEAAFRTGGPGPAWGRFVALVMHQGPVGADGPDEASWPPPGSESAGEPDDAEPDPQVGHPRSAKQQADDELFFTNMLKRFTRFLPDADSLRSSRPRIVIAVGEASGPEIARRSAEALAEQLGTPAELYPGDHGGFMGDPAGFAAAIRRTLG